MDLFPALYNLPTLFYIRGLLVGLRNSHHISERLFKTVDTPNKRFTSQWVWNKPLRKAYTVCMNPS
jgi:hypothetical protein